MLALASVRRTELKLHRQSGHANGGQRKLHAALPEAVPRLPMRYQFDPERLACWYLRLNGFLSIENFIVHNEGGRAQRTDLDLVALRFPNRREALRGYADDAEWMADDRRFRDKTNPFAAFVEVTTKQCKLNGAWTDRAKANVPRAIRALGVFSTPQEVEEASEKIYTAGRYASDKIELGLISIGESPNPDLSAQLRNVMQIVWSEITGFIFDRFAAFERIKEEHSQWDLDGHLLWHVFQEHRGDKAAFSSAFVLIPVRPCREAIEKYCQSKIYPRARP